MLSSYIHVRLFATLWTITHQAPLSMGFSRQEYWSQLPCPPPGDLPDPGVEPTSLMSPVLAGGYFTTSATWEALNSLILPLKKKNPEFLCNVIQSMPFLCWKAFIKFIPLELVKGLNPSSLSSSPLPQPPTPTPILDNLLITSQHSWPPFCGSFFQKSFYICWSLSL